MAVSKVFTARDRRIDTLFGFRVPALRPKEFEEANQRAHRLREIVGARAVEQVEDLHQDRLGLGIAPLAQVNGRDVGPQRQRIRSDMALGEFGSRQGAVEQGLRLRIARLINIDSNQPPDHAYPDRGVPLPAGLHPPQGFHVEGLRLAVGAEIQIGLAKPGGEFQGDKMVAAEMCAALLIRAPKDTLGLAVEIRRCDRPDRYRRAPLAIPRCAGHGGGGRYRRHG